MEEDLAAAAEDISDLQGEFEAEKEYLLDTIRLQDRQLKLHQQLLAQVIPLLRRDCNYMNIEAIKKQAQWDAEKEIWRIPKVKLNSGDVYEVGHLQSVGEGHVDRRTI